MLERCLQDLRLQGLRLQELWLHLRYMLYLERGGVPPAEAAATQLQHMPRREAAESSARG